MKQSEDIRNRGFCAGFFHREVVRCSAWVLLGAALSLAGCSKDPAELSVGPGPEIAASASLPAGLEAEFSTKAPVDGSAQTTLYFVRSDESSSGTWGGYGTTVLNASRAAGTGSRTLTFSSKQYYLTSGLKTRLVGWYPSAASYVNGVVNWTIDGTQDILLAPVQEGSKTAAMPAFTFSHKLTQLQFYCYAENQAAVNQWGRITAIRVVGQRRNCAYAIATNAFAFSGSTVSLAVPGLSASTPPVGEASARGYGQPMMIEPKTAATQLYLEIDTEKQGTQAAVIASRSYPAGQSVEIHIRIAEHIISIDPDGCEIVPWESPVKVATGNHYPYVVDGNCIVVMDDYGQADVAAYPIHRIWTTTPAHKESAWDANESGFNVVGESFQVAKADAVGKNGSSATMTWYEASGTTDATYNFAGYSACAQYSEADDQSDRGSWRLPTIREQRLIFDKRSELTSATPSTSDAYWSATGSSSSSNNSWYVYFSSGNMVSYAKNGICRVRCVRDTKVVPTRSDYPKVVNNNTILVKDNYGQADLGEYPIHARWVVTPAHEEGAWTANESGFNAVGESFQVAKADAVGKNGSSATMTWYEASGTTNATYNSAGYSACAQYSEAADQSDKGAWRLPTVRELKLIYDKRSELTSANLSSSNYYWSATSLSSSSAWRVYFYTGAISSYNVTANTVCRVRCVRVTEPVPVSADYPKTLNGNTIVVGDFIGKADPTVYPTHSKWTVTPAHAEAEWTANESDYNTLSEKRFQVAKADAVGKNGSSATMTWYEASGTTNATYNSAGYSACAQYSEAADQSDKGAWRLPTVRELNLIATLRRELTSANLPSSNYYWSATKLSSRENTAWFVDSAVGHTSYFYYTTVGGCRVRCVRDL